MNLIRLETRIEKQEGFRALPYFDSLDVPTIGIGCTHWLGKKVTMNDSEISLEQARIRMVYHIRCAIIDATKWINNFHRINPIRQEAIIEMAYQLGGYKQRKFKQAQIAGNARNWRKMSFEILDSLWHKQTKSRCEEIAEMVRYGKHIK